MLAYMRDALGIKFKIVGIFHAGTYCPEDITSLMGMGKWGKDIENGWFELIDQIYVATNYHKKLICKNRNVNSFKIKVTGFPMHLLELPPVPKEKIVVFPHRLNSDKQPELFDRLKEELAPLYPEWKFVKTQEIKRTKNEYYNLLNKSSIVVSFAKHELWGICVQEAVFYGCYPIVPNRVSYMEMYSDKFKYDNSYEYCLEAVVAQILACESANISDDLACLRQQQIERNTTAIPRMLEELHGF